MVVANMGSDSGQHEDSRNTASSQSSSVSIDGRTHDPPPAYTESPTAADGALQEDAAAAFRYLTTSQKFSQQPPVENCLAHLRLLHAFQALKEDVGYTDGLWDLWDTRANGPSHEWSPIYASLSSKQKSELTEEDERKLKLSKLREKRWALYVARAVVRYEAWWKSLMGPLPDYLTEENMSGGGSLHYERFPTDFHIISPQWEEKKLPPLDVVMVWHTHMLNPHAYLEDSMRYGLRPIWAYGMPWDLINSAIDEQFNYTVSSQAQLRWEATTNHKWASFDDPATTAMKCPWCSSMQAVAWTTCGIDEQFVVGRSPVLAGQGYGDSQLSHECSECHKITNKELLPVCRLQDDTRLLRDRGVPLRGTVLSYSNGQPNTLGEDAKELERVFPNRLVKSVLGATILSLIDRSQIWSSPTMSRVRQQFEDVLGSELALRNIDATHINPDKPQVSTTARFAIRRMISSYCNNVSPFSLDLSGAVIRQGIFVEKMTTIDWLHSPSARETMWRIRHKYERFFAIINVNKKTITVPTLDIDLAWHTHQLTPLSYYTYSNQRCLKFVNHNDKFDETRLSEAFEWTCKIYQNMYLEVYSECTCWYCETIRVANVSSIGGALGLSRHKKAADSFHSSGAAEKCPPDKSAHISAHNAVRADPLDSSMDVERQLHQRHQKVLEENYQKAKKRAEKKGRTLPDRDEYYHHWGHSYYMYSPYMYPAYMGQTTYPGGHPGTANQNGAGGCISDGKCGGGHGGQDGDDADGDGGDGGGCGGCGG